MLRNLTTLLVCLVCVVSCQTKDVTNIEPAVGLEIEQPTLEAWWSFFSDPELDKLVSSALSLNTDINGQRLPYPQEDINIESLQAYYKDPRVGLIRNVVEHYIEYRYIQNQKHLLHDYMYEPETEMSDEEYSVLQDHDAELQMRLDTLTSKLADETKLLPEYVAELLKDTRPIPTYKMTPLFLEDTAALLNQTSHIKAARALLAHESQERVTESDTAHLFPEIPLNRFFGISDQIYEKSESPWHVSLGHGVRSVHFGELEHNSDFRDSVLSYVLGLEHIFVNYSSLHEQMGVLKKAADQAQGKDVYKARLAALRAHYEKEKIVTMLFDKLDLH